MKDKTAVSAWTRGKQLKARMKLTRDNDGLGCSWMRLGGAEPKGGGSYSGVRILTARPHMGWQ